MNENVNIINSDEREYAVVLSDFDYVYQVSEQFERDCRRYNRALLDEQEVGVR